MKFNKIFAIILAAAGFAACSDIEDVAPQGGTLLASQLAETTSAIVERSNASFNAMYEFPGKPYGMKYNKPDDWGFIMLGFCGDLEGADAQISDSDYNWFSVCGELTSRNPNYRNPYIRYGAPYNEIAKCNDVINSFDANTTDKEILAKIAQAKALRAWSYLNLAPYFQFNYQIAGDEPCVPIVTEKTEDFTNNPRASVKEVYAQIMEDLDYAIANLEGFVRPDKSRVDQQVAYGLRARANLDMGNWAEAAADAKKAAEGYSPAQITGPAFMSLEETNWIWGYDMTQSLAQTGLYATAASWLRSFSNESYSAAVSCYTFINKMLYDMIPASDVRKGWWVDENLESPLLDGLTWNGQGNIGSLEIEDVKEKFLPYTNVKFGCNPIGTTTNEEDWPWMRVEEMILIQVEGLYKSGSTAEAITLLESFIKTYRDPSYSFAATKCTSPENEIWFQRRVELWGEGFGNTDLRRLNKPLVRFHEATKADSNIPTAFQINMTNDDGWWLMRFPEGETNTNLAVINNEGGSAPTAGQHGELTDGVTDGQ